MGDRRSKVRQVVLYARKSSKQDRRDEQSASIEAQLEACTEYAEKRGWEIVGEHSDDGRSGLLDRTRRPGLDAALTTLESRTAQGIVMLWKSRLSREELDRAVMVRDFEKQGVEWHAVADGGLVDRSTYAGYLKDGVDALFDTSYSIRVRENWQRVHADRLKDGLPKGGNPRWGYAREQRYDPRSDRYYPSGPFTQDAVTAPVLRELYLRYSGGAGFTPLVQFLNAGGHTTTQGLPWTVRSLSRMLDSGFGAGLISLEEEHRDKRGTHEPVITEDEWDAYLRARIRAKGKPRKAQAPRWYLSRIVRCGLCGGTVYINSYDSPQSAVECSNHRANPDSCTGRMRFPRRRLESMVTLWFTDHMEELAALLPTREAAAETAQQEVDAARAALDKTAEALARVTARWARGALDEASYNAVQAELEAEQKEQEGTLHAAQERLSEAGPVDLDALTRIGEFDGTPAEFGAHLARVLRQVDLHKDRVVFHSASGDEESVPRPNLRQLAAREREANKSAVRAASTLRDDIPPDR